MPDRHFLLTRVGGEYDLDTSAQETDPIVVVIIGMLFEELDQEIKPRKGDVEDFLKRNIAGRELQKKMVQLILYDSRAENKVQTIEMSFGPVQVVSVKATSKKPVLFKIMKGAHEVAESAEVQVGNQVDIVVSDWSSPSLYVVDLMSISTLQFMKMGAVAYLSTGSPDASIFSGGRYYQNLDNPLGTFSQADWKDHFTMKATGEGNPLSRNGVAYGGGGAAAASTPWHDLGISEDDYRAAIEAEQEFGLTESKYDEQRGGGYAAPFVDLGAAAHGQVERTEFKKQLNSATLLG